MTLRTTNQQVSHHPHPIFHSRQTQRNEHAHNIVHSVLLGVVVVTVGAPVSLPDAIHDGGVGRVVNHERLTAVEQLNGDARTVPGNVFGNTARQVFRKLHAQVVCLRHIDRQLARTSVALDVPLQSKPDGVWQVAHKTEAVSMKHHASDVFVQLQGLVERRGGGNFHCCWLESEEAFGFIPERPVLWGVL